MGSQHVDTLEGTIIFYAHTKKLFPTLLILLVLIVVGSGFYFYTQGTDSKQSENTSSITKPTTSISDKTYTNMEYGFEFRYPENMEIIETTYKPDWSLLRIELSNVNPSSYSTETEGGEEITIDVITSGVTFTYNLSESTSYDRESNDLQIIDNATQKVIKTMSPIIERNNWSGFIEESYESDRPYLGRIFIPSKNKKFIFNVAVYDKNNIENTILANNFWSSFRLLENTLNEIEDVEQSSLDTVADSIVFKSDSGFQFKYPSTWDAQEIKSETQDETYQLLAQVVNEDRISENTISLEQFLVFQSSETACHELITTKFAGKTARETGWVPGGGIEGDLLFRSVCIETEKGSIHIKGEISEKSKHVGDAMFASFIFSPQ